MNQAYFAVLPANVRYDKSLNAQTKLLYAEITALCSKEGYCWATNAYFAEFFNVEERTIQRWLEHLKEKDYIFVEILEGKLRRIYIDHDKNVVVTTTKMSCSPYNKKNIIPEPESPEAIGLSFDPMQTHDPRKFDSDYETTVDQDGRPIDLIDIQDDKRVFKVKYKDMVDLLLWAEKRRGQKFVNFKKQFLAMGKMAGVPIFPNQIKDRWCELEDDPYWQEKGFDFMNVASSFDKKP